MNIWTTFTPRKVAWELTYIKTKGKAASSDWQKNIKLIDNSLEKLKRAGITGIRLVIYPSELTRDGKVFNWQPIDAMLLLCVKLDIQIDLCIGPFQYPNYPGVYLPPDLIRKLMSSSIYSRHPGKRTRIQDLKTFQLKRFWTPARQCQSSAGGSQNDDKNAKRRYIDSNLRLKEYGARFLKMQLKRYGHDKRIHGFHLSNEWPDRQVVEGSKNLRLTVSENFMIEGIKLIKKLTSKPILLNTNIDAADHKKIKKVFGNLLNLLGEQGKLGMDIYPSQETWNKVPLQKLRRLILPYPQSFGKVQENFLNCEIYFAEVEAQPWGSGQSWYQLIKESEDPNKKVLLYCVDSLRATWENHIVGSDCATVSLWGI